MRQLRAVSLDNNDQDQTVLQKIMLKPTPTE
jgi:hypothetical protein